MTRNMAQIVMVMRRSKLISALRVSKLHPVHRSMVGFLVYREVSPGPGIDIEGYVSFARDCGGVGESEVLSKMETRAGADKVRIVHRRRNRYRSGGASVNMAQRI